MTEDADYDEGGPCCYGYVTSGGNVREVDCPHDPDRRA